MLPHGSTVSLISRQGKRLRGPLFPGGRNSFASATRSHRKPRIVVFVCSTQRLTRIPASPADATKGEANLTSC